MHIYTHTHTHTRILLSHKRNEILPFAMTWMELETIALIKQKKSEKETYLFTHMWNLIKQMSKGKKERQSKKQTLNYRKQTDDYQRRGGQRDK